MSDPERIVRERFFSALSDLEQLGYGEDWLKAYFSAILSGWRAEEYLYEPDEALRCRVADYNIWCEKQVGENVGRLMEEIALLAFKCLKGWNSIKSYQSYAPQLDLVISGSDFNWKVLIEYLRLDWKHRALVVEAKNLDEKVDDKQFGRLCGILQNFLGEVAGLGVFITRLGATGFPEALTESGGRVRLRVLRDSQATQVIFHAKSQKYVIVLDHLDIQALIKPGGLPRILEAKMRAIEEWAGLSIEFDDDWAEIDLPPHLMKYIERKT